MYQASFTATVLNNVRRPRHIPLLAITLTLLMLGLPGFAYAQSSQLQSLGNDCGGAFTNFGNCTAGEISISAISNLTFTGNPTNCVIGQPLTINTATVSYEINTTIRNDLQMWIGDQPGVDPRTDQSALPGSCSTYSVPGPFVDPTTAGNPFGDNDGDQCGDFDNITGTGSRDFTNINVTCQDNDNNGFADLQVLLTWSQNAAQACGTGPGQSFPTVGAPSKCDFDIVSNNSLPVVIPPRLTLVKQVTNNSGGGAVPGDWTLTATGPQVISGATGTAAVTNQVMTAGAYTLSETGPANYTGTWNCTGGGTFTPPNTITLADATPGQVVTCTVTNDDNPATLTLVKSITNDNGGTSTLANWTLTATGTSATVTGLADSASVVNQAVPAGNYTLTESGPAGYTASAWSCPGGTLNGNILTLGLGQNITCTITNNDQAANLTLTKTVINNNGGTAVAGDWTLTADAIGFTSGVQQPVNADTYTLAESNGPSGYTAGSWQCTGGSFTPPDQLTLTLGQTASCAIINDDDAPGLTLIKSVTNNNGGNDAAGSFALTVAGGTFGAGQNFSSGATPTVLAGTNYTLSETPNAGYTLTNIACVDNSNQQVLVQGQTPVLNLAVGQSATCTYTNDDDAPRLTLIKAVTNDDGGVADIDDFTLTLQGNDGTHNSAQNFMTGATPKVLSNVVYTLSEVPEPFYTNEGVVCVDDNTMSIVSHPVTLNEGQQVTCTLSNDDVARGSLTVVKNVSNDDGGPAQPVDFDLRVTGNADNCGQDGNDTYRSGDTIDPIPVDGCTYTLTETPLAGYSQVGEVSCTIDGSPASHPVIFTSGDTIVCTISNTDDGAMLALTKNVTNDNNGTAVATDWTLSADGTSTPQQGAGGFTSVKVSAGVYTLTESAGPAGYQAGAWDCGAANAQLSGNQLTLANGDEVTCSITNDDVQPQLTLTKSVINNNGGTAKAVDWTLKANATVFVTGVGQGINAGNYTLSEDGPAGYAPTGPWQCTGGGSFTPPDQLTLAPGEVVSCGIANDDIAPTLTLVKSVNNDDGALGVPGSFTLTLQGADGTHDTAQNYSSGASPTVIAGVVYTVGEQDLEGYVNEGVACVDTNNADAPVAHPVTLSGGQAVTCTLTNNDVAPTLDLTKVVINDDNGEAVAADFTLVLTGADGTHNSGVNYADGDTPTIKSNVLYTLTENPLDGYALVSIECVDSDTAQSLGAQFTPARGQNIACTVTNDDRLSNISFFRVNKDFTDDNPGEVEVFIDCSTGLILDQRKIITEGSGVIFVVTDFTPGNLNCTIFESPVPAGYSESYAVGQDDSNGNPGVGFSFLNQEGCRFEEVEGGDFFCDVINNLEPVDVVVNKVWLGEFEANGLERFAKAEYSCFNVRTNPSGSATSVDGNLTFNGDSSDEISEIFPHWNGNSFCTVDEVNVDNPVEPDASDCQHVAVTLAGAASCTIFNTLFLEGIPTLNPKALVLLAMLMLGVGLVGFRRFS